MTNQNIIDILRVFRPQFKKMSILQLNQIMIFIQLELKNKKKNWSISLLEIFLEKNKIQIFTIELFYKEYSHRKKHIKTFENLLIRYKSREKVKFEKFIKTNIDPLGKIELINKSQSVVNEFLKELKLIKGKYLIGKDDDFIEIISKNIKTGYTQSTLRNYYYNNYIDS